MNPPLNASATFHMLRHLERHPNKLHVVPQVVNLSLERFPTAKVVLGQRGSLVLQKSCMGDRVDG